VGTRQPPPTRRPTAAEAARKPLLGFGPAGWLALPVLVALLAVVATGDDLRYAIQKLIADNLGIPPLMDFTTYGIVHTGLGAGTWPPVGRFGPTSMAIVLVALAIHPRRAGLCRPAMIWLLGLFGPALVLRGMSDTAFRRLTGDTANWEIGGIVWLFAAATAIWLATRSWRVGLPAGACLALPVAAEITAFLAQTDDLPRSLGSLSLYHRQLSLLMHASLAGVLWTWAIRARRGVIPPYACQHCGYDVRSIPPPCPECGTRSPSVDLPRPTPPPLKGGLLDPNGAPRDQEHDRIR